VTENRFGIFPANLDGSSLTCLQNSARVNALLILEEKDNTKESG
jgi:hypothetical protein